VDREHLGLAFGLHRAMDNAGAVLGPLAAYALLAGGANLRGVFLWSLAPAALVLLLSLAVPEFGPTAPPAPVRFDWRLRDLPHPRRRYRMVVALFTLGNSSNMFLLLRANELGMSQSQVPLLWRWVTPAASVRNGGP